MHKPKGSAIYSKQRNAFKQDSSRHLHTQYNLKPVLDVPFDEGCL